MWARSEHVVAHVALLALAGCCAAACNQQEDPSVVDNGPTFVVIGKSDKQPPLPSEGISMFVEARGGNYVGLLTHGCGHSLAGLSNEGASCGVLPDATDPMYFLVNAVPGRACTVEARLYYVCDDAGLLPAGLSGLGQFEWCDTVGSLMGSVTVPIYEPTDASADGGPIDEITDATAPTADVGDIRVGRPL